MMIDCRVLLQDDILTLETGWIRRQYRWNNGRLISLRIEDVVRGHGWSLAGKVPDLAWIGDGGAQLGACRWRSTRRPRPRRAHLPYR
jgi:hypothetical protein